MHLGMHDPQIRDQAHLINVKLWFFICSGHRLLALPQVLCLDAAMASSRTAESTKNRSKKP
jgi:hypothetical protein